ncbi:MAG TPA: hypothetical protein VLM80_09130 [Anaerolineales bacterium]|nr:hypothetical protein [Anaerolineales bacterium]
MTERTEAEFLIMDDISQIFPGLSATCSKGAGIVLTEEHTWRLQTLAGGSKHYRLAQLDDYHHLTRSKFLWRAGSGFQLRARACEQEIPGTWGFGFWNDPFSMGFLGDTGKPRWPVLPQTAWFFFASRENHLSIRDDVPGKGSLAMTYAASNMLNMAVYPGLPGMPFLVFRPVARLVRKVFARLLKQDAYKLDLDPTLWHTYGLKWEEEAVIFQVDYKVVFETKISPAGPLGFVLWLDNQYAAFTPQGQISYGFLPNPQAAWIEVSDVHLEDV